MTRTLHLRSLAVSFSLALLISVDTGYAASLPAVEADSGMVVSSQRHASEAGLAMLKQGGNAIDAAVAVGYALAVVNPCCGNIGGGGFMTIRLADGTRTFIDFRETAPAAATPGMYLDAAGNSINNLSLAGYLAAGVPGTVKGLDYALSKYGTLPRIVAMAPAIDLAAKGYVLSRADTDVLDFSAALLRQDKEAARLFLRYDGTSLRPGDQHVQSDLARTLQAIAIDGPDVFYQGLPAHAVAAASTASGGLLTAADFAAYSVRETAPVTCTYRGFEIISAAPPSSGGTALCEILNILEGYDLKAMGFHSAQAVHVLVEAMRRAYPDRNTYLGDPAFTANPLAQLLSKEYAARLRETISLERATASKDIKGGLPTGEKPETTHYSVVDAAGNAVSVTYTINGAFGAGVVAPGTGFLLNNEMDDFTVKPGVPNLYGLVQGETNAIAPGKRPLSSMAPTIVTKDGKLFLVLGSPGGSRIITIVLQTIINITDYGMRPQEAVDAPRIHHQWLPDIVYHEPFALSPDTLKLLAAMGHKMVMQRPWGAAELIAVGQPPSIQDMMSSAANDTALSGGMLAGKLYGANDSRRPAGAAMGN